MIGFSSINLYTLPTVRCLCPRQDGICNISYICVIFRGLLMLKMVWLEVYLYPLGKIL